MILFKIDGFIKLEIYLLKVEKKNKFYWVVMCLFMIFFFFVIEK